jgi:hypothetical protein
MEGRSMKWDIRDAHGKVLPGVVPFEAETEDEAREIAMAALGRRVTAHRCASVNCACKPRETETRCSCGCSTSRNQCPDCGLTLDGGKS